MTHSISIAGLVKEYDGRRVVDEVGFHVAAGEVYALLGHNGAGKSTIVEILEGHRTRMTGDVTVLGMDPAHGGRELRDRIGIVLQSSGIEDELTVTEAVDAYRACYRRPRPTAEVVAMVGLDEQADQRIGSLSGGQRRRIDLALGIVGQPDVLFLDEPTTGFDPAARRGAWELVRRLGEGGTTVLLTTHYLDEAERLADRIGVLSHGVLIAEGTPAELVARSGRTTVQFGLPDGTPADDLAGLVPRHATVDARRVSFATETPTAAVHAVTSWAVERGLELADLQVTRPSLEDAFLGLVEPADDGEELP